MRFYCTFYKKGLQKIIFNIEDMLEKIKIKPLTKQQIIISLDRLTRFKYTEDKYLRVFKDIISSNLIYPKYKKKELDLMNYDNLKKIVEDVFNYSFKQLNIDLSDDFKINKKLLDYEKSVFKFDKNVEKLLQNRINYKAAIELLSQSDSNLPLNLKWLKFLASDEDQILNRESYKLKFPLEKIVIVEGITEEILLPKFAKLCGYDFDTMGIYLIAAGGKNPVVKLFYQLVNFLKLPIFVLLDSDAEDNLNEIKPKLRIFDKVYILKKGEFEDVLPLNLIKRTINRRFRNYFSIQLEDLRKDELMTKTLALIFKENGFEFKKAEFAALISENIKDIKDVSDRIKDIILQLKNS